MTKEKKAISKADGLEELKHALRALVRTGVPFDEIIKHTNSILQEFIYLEAISSYSNNKLGKGEEKHISRLGDLVFDSLRGTLIYKGQIVELSPNEIRMMGYFINNPDNTITHNEIIELLYSDLESDGEPASICIQLIFKLRKKLSTFPEGENWIETVRGKGYVFVGTRKRK